MRNQQEYPRLIISLLVSGSLIAFLLWLLTKVVVTSKSEININYDKSALQDYFSLGEKSLITEDISSDKEDGTKAFAEGDFNTALHKFKLSLNTTRNDPETLIYLNNAKIGKSKAFKVAVIVGIGSVDVDKVKETLRGVAQAQKEVNDGGGINGTPLQIEIVKSVSDPQLDQELVNDANIIAVIGYRDTKVYQDQGLVRISTFNPGNSQKSAYVFYATPNQNAFSDVLAKYIVQKAHVDNVAICRDSKSLGTNDLKNIVPQYKQSMQSNGIKVANIDCDFSDPKFRASTVIEKAIAAGAEGLVVMPAYNNPHPALEIAKENQGRLRLFGNQLMYQGDILKSGSDVRGTVLVVPWFHDALPGNPFAENAAKLWGGPVSPSTAVAYDATEIIIAGLKIDNTRHGLQKALNNPKFSAQGATKIEFTPSVDAKGAAQGTVRQGGVFLVKIEPCDPTKSCNSDSGYNYVLAD